MSHHELKVVDDHVGDVIHVDSVLHGVNHCPGWGETGISRDQPQGSAEARMGLLSQAWGQGEAEWGGTRLTPMAAGC